MKENERKIANEIETLTGVDATYLMEIGLLPSKVAKKWLVRKLYYKMGSGKRTYADIKIELSDRYSMSISTIEKMIYGKR